MNAMQLVETQRAMQHWLLEGDAAFAAMLNADDADERAARMRIYADAYRLRLCEVLGNDFPVLKSSLGETAFDALAADYLHAHPSRAPSVRHFGSVFADWLRERDPLAASLASFEWAQGEVFDAVDASVCGIDALATLPPECWQSLRLSLQPALRRLSLDSNAPALVDAHARDVMSPSLAITAASEWLLWRRDFDVHWRRLDADEAAALDAVAAGEDFAQWCERLPGEQPALRAAGLLKRWFEDGVITAISHAGHECTEQLRHPREIGNPATR